MRREASGLVAALLQWHIERGLKSLPLVDRGSLSPAPELRGYPAARGAALLQARADAAAAVDAVEVIA